jgi:hypothetical protein
VNSNSFITLSLFGMMQSSSWTALRSDFFTADERIAAQISRLFDDTAAE